MKHLITTALQVNWDVHLDMTFYFTNFGHFALCRLWRHRLMCAI